MTASFPVPQPLDTYPRIGLQELRARFPNAKPSRFGDDEFDEFDDFYRYYESHEFVLVSGDVHIPPDWQPEDLRGKLIVIDGSLQVAHCPLQVFLVTGELRCDSINLDESRMFPDDARVFARHWARVFAEDHEASRQAPIVRLQAPYVFCWFYQLDNIDLAPETVVFILSDWDYSHNLDLPNPMFRWQEALYALRGECAGWVSNPNSDEIPWCLEGASRLLAKGQSLFIDGFTLQSLPYKVTGDECLTAGDPQRAYLAHRHASALSPSYYCPWFGMGEALYAAGAYEQALPHYRHAAALFPPGQPGLVNDAANCASLCAIRTRRLDEAVEFATLAIENNREYLETEDYQSKACAPAYRMRGEALHLMGRHDEALTDLRRAVALDERHGTALWLLGLLCQHSGDANEAERLRQEAIGRDAAYDVVYETAPGALQSTDFLGATPTRVDWEEAPAGYALPVKDEAYWLAVMAQSDPEKIKQVPTALRTTALCTSLLDKADAWTGWARFARHFPAEAFTPALAQSLVRLAGTNLSYVPPALIIRQLCLQAPLPDERGSRGFALECLSGQLLDRELVLHAVRCGSGLQDVPEQFLDREVCLAALRLWPYELKHVPSALRDDECYFTAIVSGSMHFFTNDLPGVYRTPEMLKRVIEHDKRALDRIAGRDFDAELLGHAQALYGNDPDWADLVARHSPAFCRANPSLSCHEVCWSAFWDEAFMLQQIGKVDDGLSPFQIPAPLFTQAIADACMRRDLVHLNKVPRQFITPAMCDRFSREYPGMLDHIPVALRTPEICKRAMHDDPAVFPELPLACRNVALCMRAVRADSAAHAEQVPLDLQWEVSNRLLKQPDSDLRTNWLYLWRGDAALALNPPDIQRALADYELVLAATADDELTANDIEFAKYSIGYCKHLQGLNEQAQAWREKLAVPDDWTPYEEYTINPPREPRDVNRWRFEDWTGDVEKLTRDQDLRTAFASLQCAEQVLVDDEAEDPWLWARLLGPKIELSEMLGMREVCARTCQEAVERFNDEEWVGSRGEEDIRRVLCDARQQLADILL